MKLTLASRTLGIAALTALAAPLAMAQSTGWYGGASVGRSGVTIDDARIQSGLLGQGLGTASIDDRDRGTGYKLFGGYQFTPNIALEAGLHDLGHFGFTARTVPAGTLDGEIRMRGLNLDLVGTIPLAGRLSALGRIGVVSERASSAFTTTGAARNPYAGANVAQRNTGAKVGLGLAYAFTPALGMRVEAERYRVKDGLGNTGHVDMLSLGLVYRFGVDPQPVRMAEVMEPRRPDPVPMPMATPEPMPQVVPMPPPAPVPRAAPVRINLAADALFDFDKSTLRPNGRAQLDKLGTDLRGMTNDTVRITGHTDRLGSHAYNLKLSARRAETVREYLVSAGSVAAGRISAQGVDGANPVTRPEDCRGAKPTPALIACLQPDRRVEVEVSGTR